MLFLLAVFLHLSEALINLDGFDKANVIYFYGYDNRIKEWKLEIQKSFFKKKN